jgi:N-acetylglutamate synthase-like GNAT family acetyltransferase
MKTRKARAEDRRRIYDLAESLGLDYPGMEDDDAWIAEEGGQIAGIVALKKHADCDELVSLGVDPEYRDRGLGRRLVRALLEEAPGDVFLATVIPDFFERCGFKGVSSPPAGMTKDPVWCEGCPKERCTIMVRTAR